MGSFPREEFDAFCRDLRVATKERGVVRLGEVFLGTQKRVLAEIAAGFDKGVHEFIVLKCRQIGMSTLTMALDLFWIQAYEGTVGVLVTQDEGTREQFRSTLQLYYDGLPEEWQITTTQHNRNQLVLENGSMLLYRVAGTKKTSSSGNLGRSAAPILIHGTEVSSWASREGIASLKNSASERNPRRLYIYESTARGFNDYYRMWVAARESVGIKCIFVSWWANEFYRCQRDTDMWHAYWGKMGRATEEEKRRAREVRLLYDVELTPEMIAWYRWYEAEKCYGDDLMAMQEMPWTENEAFVATGSRFFSAKLIGELYRKERSMDSPQYLRLIFKDDFRATEVVATTKQVATLEVYEEPVKGAYYVMGADPAYGSSENADRFVASVWRCYSDRLEQAAEFCCADMQDFQFAWVVVYLAGAYEPCLLNLEINGPGQVVDNEITNLRKQVLFAGDPGSTRLRNVLGSMRTFLWQTPQGLSRSPSGRHTISTHNVIERYMGEFKDYSERGMMTVRSRGLIDEMQNFERDEGGSLAAGAKGKDDRCIAAGLAVMAWNDAIRTTLMARGMSYAAVHQRENQAEVSPTSRVVSRFLLQAGVTVAPKPEIPGVKSGIPAAPRASARRRGYR